MKTFSFYMKFLVVVLLSFHIFGCGTTSLLIPVTRPAEINLSKFKKIAIGEITGQASDDVTDELTTALFESNLFEVLDRTNLDKILREHNLSASGLVDEKTAAEFGQLIGAAAMVFGRVADYKYDEKVTKGDPWTDKGGKYHQYYYRKGESKVTVNFKIIDLTTGKLLVSKSITQGGVIETSADNQQPEAIDRDNLLAFARKLVVKDFMKKIAPYQEIVRMYLKSDSDLPELEKGISFAKAGQWDRAIENFKLATEKYPGNENLHKAYYDLGVAYMYNQMFKESIDALNKAYELKADEDYLTEIQNCKNMESEYKKLQEQLK